MSWLSAWLKEIIAVILIASFIDLILPNRSMERYVKLVVSLFILVTLLSPVVRLFQQDLNVNVLAAQLSLESREKQPQAVPVDAVLQEGERRRTLQQHDAIRQVELSVERITREQVEAQTGYKVERVEAKVTPPAEPGGQLKLERLSVAISASASASAAASAPGARTPDVNRKPIAEVEPVSIGIRVGRETGGGDILPAEEQGGRKGATEAELAMKRTVEQLLRKHWEAVRGIEVQVVR